MSVNDEEKRQLVSALFFPAVLLCLVWFIKLVEVVAGISFGDFGIYPREVSGLAGIVFSPLIHADFKHLINNSLPLFLLTTATFYFYRSIAFKIIVIVWLVTGLCVWIGGRSAYHIGASSLIYAEAAFLFFSGVIRKNIKLLAISLLVILLYGGMVWGIFPIDMRISWESHLFGGLTGATFAFIFADEGPKNEKIDWDDEDEEDPYWENTDEEESK
jgi:membrane associated rhomboid family serine protease